MGLLGIKITWLRPTRCHRCEQIGYLHNKISRAASFTPARNQIHSAEAIVSVLSALRNMKVTKQCGMLHTLGQTQEQLHAAWVGLFRTHKRWTMSCSDTRFVSWFGSRLVEGVRRRQWIFLALECWRSLCWWKQKPQQEEPAWRDRKIKREREKGRERRCGVGTLSSLCVEFISGGWRSHLGVIECCSSSWTSVIIIWWSYSPWPWVNTEA